MRYFNYVLLSHFRDASRTPECKRHLETKLNSTDTPESIAQELADFAFISEHDVEVMRMVIDRVAAENKRYPKSLSYVFDFLICCSPDQKKLFGVKIFKIG